MKNVAAALVLQEGRIMLTRRAPGQKLEGHWEFPGGKQEPDETIQQCIEREIEEELSMPCSAGLVFMESIYCYEGGAINLIGVLVEVSDVAPSLTVHDQVAWVPLPDLLSYRLAPADIPIAKELIKVYG